MQLERLAPKSRGREDQNRAEAIGTREIPVTQPINGIESAG